MDGVISGVILATDSSCKICQTQCRVKPRIWDYYHISGVLVNGVKVLRV